MFLIYSWLTNLQGTDSYYSVYLLCAFGSLLAFLDNHRKCYTITKKEHICLGGFSILFSLAVILANYYLHDITVELRNLYRTFDVILALLGGTVAMWNILLWFGKNTPLSNAVEDRNHSTKFFLITFLSILAIDLLYLFTDAYPGRMTADTFGSIREFMNDGYSNLNPFWYTVTIELFYTIGNAIFHEINAAFAFVTICFMIFMAACIAYSLTTLYEVKVSKLAIACAYIVNVLLPHCIVYSVTLWKDVLFSGAALLLVTSLYRILCKVGKLGKLDYVMFAIGSVGLSVWRTNGWYAYAFTALVLTVFLWRQYKRLIVMMVSTVVICWILINPVLHFLNVYVGGTNMIEAFSIPLQQIGRVVYYDGYLTGHEQELLSQAIDLDIAREEYDPKCADPMKWHAVRRDNIDYIEEHMMDYVKVWGYVGLRYPGEYIKAWIEQTKGYWNGGYDYWRYASGIKENEFGLVNSVEDNPIRTGFSLLFRWMEKMEIFQPLFSIGLYVWLLIISCIINALKGRKEALLAVPLLVIVFGLWLGTPIYAEFRYAYPVVLTLPFILCVTLYHKETDKKK